MVENKIKAICLFSGGLDSCLAVKILQLQGIEVIALYIDTPFIPRPGGGKYAEILRRRALAAGGELEILTVGMDYLELIRLPEFGYGKNMNPCIDCKIFFYKQAYELLKEKQAQFIATGEVVGQRPMTQSKTTLLKQERLAGVERMVLRPLSAKLLPITIPEERGWVNRDRLYDISGRTRSRQLALAKELGITDYAQPAGGCLLTNVEFARRLRDLFDHNVTDMNDIILLKVGRHFRLSPTVKLIVGRNQSENKFIAEMVAPDDILLEVVEYGSPLCLLRGKEAKEFIPLAARICKYYSDARNVNEARIRCWQSNDESVSFITVKGTIESTTLTELIIT